MFRYTPYPFVTENYPLGRTEISTLDWGIEQTDAAGAHPWTGARTKEGRPALNPVYVSNSTFWMSAGHMDRSSLTFADVPAYTPFNKKGEQQCRH
jgi:hypothetical protein